MEINLGFTVPPSDDVVSIGGDDSFSGYKLVPWISWEDWRFVKDGLFSSSPISIASSLRRASAWRSRGCVPVIVEVTASIIEIEQKDPFFRDDVSENLLHSEEMLAMLYSMAIVRWLYQMFNAGHQHELFRGYSEIRSASMEQSLKKLGVEPLGKEDVQKLPWEALEAKIGNWIHFMRIAVKLLFAGEKKVCDQIFEGLESLRDQCFADVCGESVSILLCFGEAIARSKRSPEKLFVLLDMYEIMKEILPEFNEILGSKHCVEMREAAKNLTKRLAQTSQDIFGDFEEAVEKDATRINYVKFLFVDKPGQHDFTVLKRLVLSDGAVLRARYPGRPTRDCLFSDPITDICMYCLFVPR